ncbi:MAG: ABC transporter permease [Gemmatimonadota bacterium]
MNAMNTFLRDLSFALRRCRRSPGFTAVVVAVLALGIGATTAIFTVLDHVVLRPLPYEEADRLVYIDAELPGEGSDTNWGLSEAGFFYLRDNNRTFEEIGAYGGAEAGHEVTIVGSEGGSRVTAAYVSHSLLDLLRARPSVGRLIREEDDGWMRPGGPGVLSVAVLGHDFWLREFGGDPNVVGTTLQLEGELSVEVLGVLEPGFQMPHDGADLWLPLGLHPTRTPTNFHGYRVIGRLAEGITLDAASADLARLTAQLPEAFPEVYTTSFMRESGFRTRATPLRARVLGGLDEVLWILFGSVGLLLLIAYSNVTNLFLVRADARRRDGAIRRALGGGRLGLARQVLSETLLLSLIAAGIGVWLADGAIRLFVALAPFDVPRLGDASIGLASLAMAVILALFAWVTLACVLILSSSSDLTVLRDGGVRQTASRSRHRVRGAFVVTQMALSLVLLADAGVMFRSFVRLRSVNPGLEPADVLLVDLHPPATRDYLQPSSVQRLYREVVTRVSAIPGVEEASVGGVPLTYEPVCLAVYLEDRPLEPGQIAPCVNQSTVAPGFFETLGIPLQGREVTWADTERGLEPWAGGEVVLTRALAARLWPGEEPIGKGIRLRVTGAPYARVVGVTGDLYGDGLDRPPAEHVFGQLWYRSNTLVVKLNADAPEDVAALVQSTIRGLDLAVAIGSIQTMGDVLARSATMARASLTLILVGIGAMMGLILSAVGLFGVLAYVVGQRQGEIGIRMAIGAPMRRVAAMVIGDSLKLVVMGVALGLLGALPATQLLRSLLFEVSPGDPISLLIAATLLVLVALVASWLPAHRAARVDPMVALRAE